MNSRKDKVVSIAQAASIAELLRSQNKVVVLCHGTFDLLHPGHLRHFSEASSLGDVLMVSLTADEFVNKGPGRPVFNSKLRLESIAALEDVDYVFVVDEATALPAIAAVRPQVYAKGTEYANPANDPTGKINDEKPLVEKYGGRVAYVGDVVFSSSTLINRFISTSSGEAHQWLRDFRQRTTADQILAYLDRLQELRVLVVGEAILDVYSECDPLGVAAKEPVLCIQFVREQVHAGGSLAVAAHCSGVGADVTTLTMINPNDFPSSVSESIKDTGIDLRIVESYGRPSIRKHRYVDRPSQTRLLEIYTMDDKPLTGKEKHAFADKLVELSANVDVILVADYGHGLIDAELAALLSQEARFLAVNAQTNAGNHGFNFITKYPSADFIAMNGRELQLEARRRHCDPAEVVPGIMEATGAKTALVTLGSQGVQIFDSGGVAAFTPALATNVLDKVGAGDAVLSVASLLAAVETPPEVVSFVSSLVGGWAVGFLGNAQSVDIGSLKRAVVSSLK